MASDSQADIKKSNEIKPKEHRSHPKLVVFLVCLVISILMWLFIELMKDYNDEIQYSISFTNIPKDLILTNSGDSIITVGMNAQGFELLAAKYARKHQSLNIDLSKLKIRPTGEGFTAFLPSARIIDQLGSQIRFRKEIAYIKPDTIFFRFSSIVKKTVPVVLDFTYTVGGQYDITDSVTFEPRFVMVSSIKSIIDTLSYVKTEKLKLSNLDSTLNMRIPLFKGKNARLLKYSTDSVTLRLTIEKITESSYSLPVSVKSNGENIKIFPNYVDVIFRVPLSVYPQLQKSDFEAQVDYLSASKDKKLKVNIIKSPEHVRILTTVPQEVEYIIIAK